MDPGGVDEVTAGPATGPPEQDQLVSSHGGSPPRGLAHLPRSSVDRGRYGRMFRELPPFAPHDATLKALADSMGPYPPAPMPPGPVPPPSAPQVAADPAPPPTPPPIQPGENPDIPSGYTYLGQFVDHDITFDPTSVLERRNDPDALVDYRTPRFDL